MLGYLPGFDEVPSAWVYARPQQHPEPDHPLISAMPWQLKQNCPCDVETKRSH